MIDDKSFLNWGLWDKKIYNEYLALHFNVSMLCNMQDIYSQLLLYYSQELIKQKVIRCCLKREVCYLCREIVGIIPNTLMRLHQRRTFFTQEKSSNFMGGSQDIFFSDTGRQQGSELLSGHCLEPLASTMLWQLERTNSCGSSSKQFHLLSYYSLSVC